MKLFIEVDEKGNQSIYDAGGFVKHANDLIELNDSNEPFRYKKEEVLDAVSYVRDMWYRTVVIIDEEELHEKDNNARFFN